MQYKAYGVQLTAYGLEQAQVSEAEAKLLLTEAFEGFAGMLTKQDKGTGMVLHVNPMTNTCISLTKLSGGDWLIGEYFDYDAPKMLSFGFVTETVAELTKH